MYPCTHSHREVSPAVFQVTQKVTLTKKEMGYEFLLAIFYKIASVFRRGKSQEYNDLANRSWKLFRGTEWLATIDKEFPNTLKPVLGELYNPQAVGDYAKGQKLFVKEEPKPAPASPAPAAAPAPILVQPPAATPASPPPAAVATPAPAPAPVVPKVEVTRTLTPKEAFDLISDKDDIEKSGIRQFTVLHQNGDNTKFGEQNCGFHALKNAIIALKIASNYQDSDKNLFSNRQVCTSFYNKYFKHYVATEKDAPKDFGPEILPQVIRDFIQDKNPPKELENLQKALILSQDALSIMNFSASAEGIRFGLLDEFWIQNALKLFRFAKASGPAVMSIMLGRESTALAIVPTVPPTIPPVLVNVNVSHWYTAVYCKDAAGKLTVFLGDSQENTHKDIHLQPGGFKSAAVPLIKFLTDKVNSPDDFIKRVFDVDLGPYLTQTVEKITKGDKLEILAIMLDEKPNALLAREGQTDGSQLQLNINKLRKIYKLMLECGWLTSFDAEKMKYKEQLLKVINFYIGKMEYETPLKLELIELRDSILTIGKKEKDKVREARAAKLAAKAAAA